ncbi:hypothetical protein HYS49_02150 [Candidatus Woesearchaeota archaeon]|nr:hypothetical protein [Candidatus Woesearchaeota archaeon]
MVSEKDLLLHLRQEVEDLKKRLEHPVAQTKELFLEMETLKDSIHELNAIFKRALKEAKEEEVGGSLLSLKEDMKTVLRRTETLAQGLLALSEQRAALPSRPRSTPSVGAPPTPTSMLQHRMGIPPLPGLRMAPPLLQQEMGAPSMARGSAPLPPPPPPLSARKERKLL